VYHGRIGSAYLINNSFGAFLFGEKHDGGYTVVWLPFLEMRAKRKKSFSFCIVGIVLRNRWHFCPSMGTACMVLGVGDSNYTYLVSE